MDTESLNSFVNQHREINHIVLICKVPIVCKRYYGDLIVYLNGYTVDEEYCFSGSVDAFRSYIEEYDFWDCSVDRHILDDGILVCVNTSLYEDDSIDITDECPDTFMSKSI